MAEAYYTPIGSIDERGRDENNKQLTTVRGKYGATRHQGYFSDSNPYLKNMLTATNNQDIDALYNKALQWESDQANLKQQLEINKSVLAEQRLYDSPENQIARQRDAGINPDLGGSSGSSSGSSGSSAGMTPVTVPEQEDNIPTSNAYQNTELVFSGLDTAASLVNSFAGTFGQIVSGVSQIKKLPSEILTNESQAELQSAQANEINTLLSGKKDNLSLINSGLSIQNSMDRVNLMYELATKISPETTDISGELSKLGIAEEDIPTYSEGVSLFHKHPSMATDFARAELARRFAEADNDVYVQDMVYQIADLQGTIRLNQLQSDRAVSHIQSSMNNFLDSCGYGKEQAELLLDETALGQDSVDLARSKLKHDTAIWIQGLRQRDSQIQSNNKEIERLRKLGLTPYRLSLVNRLKAENVSLLTMNSNEFHKIKESFLKLSYTISENELILDENGNMRPIASLEQEKQFMQITYQDVIHNGDTEYEVANKFLNTAIEGAKAGAIMYGASRYTKSNPITGQTIVQSNVNSVTNKPVPYRQTDYYYKY